VPPAAPATEPIVPPARNGATAPNGDRAVAVELGPVVLADAPAGTGRQENDDEDGDQADPQEVRRQIAAASRSFDPDHQVRRAMDAFFSPSAFPNDRERGAPDH
jgi:hypothetical protein